MKKLIPLLGGIALIVAGCASTKDDTKYVSQERYYVTEEPRGGVAVESHERVYVRQVAPKHDREFQNNMEPAVRGKHAESLGWNTENYYRQRGYVY
jgi:hypothetical protein